MSNQKIAITVSHVSKEYKLYKNPKQRFMGLFFDKVPYKVVKASNDLNFKVYQGESVALLGKNGAGKTTILQLITGSTFPTKGKIVTRGRINALLALTAGFEPDFTGRENIYLRGQLAGMKKKEIAVVEEKIIKFSALGVYIDQPVRTYSSGMKARLGFAVSIHLNPEILIVDEALSVGDKNFQKKCKKKVREVMKKDKVTVLFVTHNSKSAKEFCTRGIILNKGQILFDGDIEEAVERYEAM